MDKKNVSTAIVVAAFAGVIAAIIAGSAKPEPDPDGLYTRVPWATPKPANPTCGYVSVIVGPREKDLLKLTNDGKNSFAYAKLCFDPDTKELDLSDGKTLAPVSAFTPSNASDEYQVEVWLAGKSRDGGDGFPCACRSDAGSCEVSEDGSNWTPAPAGTLKENTWRGKGCFRKSCVDEPWGTMRQPECL